MRTEGGYDAPRACALAGGRPARGGERGHGQPGHERQAGGERADQVGRPPRRRPARRVEPGAVAHARSRARRHRRAGARQPGVPRVRPGARRASRRRRLHVRARLRDPGRRRARVPRHARRARRRRHRHRVRSPRRRAGRPVGVPRADRPGRADGVRQRRRPGRAGPVRVVRRPPCRVARRAPPGVARAPPDRVRQRPDALRRRAAQARRLPGGAGRGRRRRRRRPRRRHGVLDRGWSRGRRAAARRRRDGRRGGERPDGARHDPRRPRAGLRRAGRLVGGRLRRQRADGLHRPAAHHRAPAHPRHVRPRQPAAARAAHRTRPASIASTCSAPSSSCAARRPRWATCAVAHDGGRRRLHAAATAARRPGHPSVCCGWPPQQTLGCTKHSDGRDPVVTRPRRCGRGRTGSRGRGARGSRVPRRRACRRRRS